MAANIYPNHCCQCGFCCLSETCPVGQLVYGVGKNDPCPGLFFHLETAICQIAFQGEKEKKLIGVGSGCCIKARAIQEGVAYDFASLSPVIKRSVAKAKRRVRL